MEAKKFYKWWTNTVRGNYIRDSEFERVLQRFEPEQNKNEDNNLKLIK